MGISIDELVSQIGYREVGHANGRLLFRNPTMEGVLIHLDTGEWQLSKDGRVIHLHNVEQLVNGLTTIAHDEGVRRGKKQLQSAIHDLLGL